MQRALCLAAALLLAFSPLTGCAAFRYQHAHAPAPQVAATQVAGPVQPPTAEFRKLRSDAQTAQVRGEAEETKQNLATQGHYACCIKPACNECLLRRGECHCRDLVQRQTPCGECTQAWINGRGAVDGVNAADLVKRKEQEAAQGRTVLEDVPPEP